MVTISQPFSLSAPGRICLFGEHQDYLGLPVISMAINLRMTISGEPRNDDIFRIEMPDIGAVDEFCPADEIEYRNERDYIRSAVNVLKRRGFDFEQGCDFIIKSALPISAGVGSSSALVVVWIAALLHLHHSLEETTGEDIVKLAHEAEVLEFNEPGGMMDHYTCTLGGMLHIDCGNEHATTPIARGIGEFVLGDSLEEKDTRGVLGRTKHDVRKGIEMMKKILPDFDLATTPEEEIIPLLRRLPDAMAQKIYANIVNRDLCRRAFELLQEEYFDQDALGELIDSHHAMLRDHLGISTPKIEKMIAAAKKAGALGCKINGSGGGGTMIAYAPGRARAVADAIELAGGKAYIVKKDIGLQLGLGADARLAE